MDISKSSWHYKLLSFFSWVPLHYNATFCQYAWKVFVALFVVCIIGPIVISGMIFDAYTLFILWSQDIALAEGQGPGAYMMDDHFGISAEEHPFVYLLAVAAMVFGGIAWIGVATCLLLISIIWVIEQISDYRAARLPASKEPGFFKMWWKSYKEKHCPIIEYKD